MPDDKIIIPIVAQLDTLDTGLRAGERKIADSTRRMETTAQKGGGNIGRKIASGIIAGFGAVAIDRALEAGLASFNAGDRGIQLGVAIADGVVTGMRSIPIAGALGEVIARTLDANFGSGQGTIAEQEARRQAERARGTSIQDATRRFGEALTDDTLTPTQRLERDLQRQRRELLETIGNNPKLQREILPRIDKAIQERLGREQAKEKVKFDASKFIDTFSTPFGNVKLAAPGTPGVKAQFDTAENTKRTARDVEAIRKKLDALGALGFN